MAQGIDSLEAKARIDSLSDTEVMRIAYEIDKLPAGAGELFMISWGGGRGMGPAWIGTVFITIVVLIIVGIVWLITTNWREDTNKK